MGESMYKQLRDLRARRSAADRWPEEALPFAGPQIRNRSLAPKFAAVRWPGIRSRSLALREAILLES